MAARARPGSSSAPHAPEIALSRDEGDDVLRYWLAGLRLEEALQARPAARLTSSGAGTPRLDQPTPAHEYFKIPLDASVVELLSKQARLTRAFDAELCGFFETWLHGQYRRSDDESELSHLLCFPVVHLPKGELAGLLRCGVRLRFANGTSQEFRAPTRAERQRGSYPAAPDEVRLTRVPQADGAWPFYIDTRLLRQPLGVPTESIDALFEALRRLTTVSEQQMLAFLTTMLVSVANGAGAQLDSVASQAERLRTAVASEHCGVDVWLGRLTAALRRLLEASASRARVYAVGIVVDGTQAKITWHLQREIEALLEGKGARWKVASPLGAYLTGQPLPAGSSPQRALFPGPALSVSQRVAAESFWGSSLSAVQGPPGTGKTRLILHLCAEALVRQVEGLLGANRLHMGMLLVTSSNNRAVDNVLEPLGSVEGLPLALRAGSRQVCEQQLAAQLRRALAWLRRANEEPPPERSERLARAKARFLAQRDGLDRIVAPRRAALERAATRARLEQELRQCSVGDGEAGVGGLSAAQVKVSLLALEPLEKRLRALSKLCEVAPTAAAIRTLELHYKRTAKRNLPPVTQALSNAQLTVALPLPPAASDSAKDIAQQLEEWEEAAELGLSRLAELRLALERTASTAQLTDRAQRLRSQLAALGPAPTLAEAVPDVPELSSRDLFAAALAAREAWASEHAEELIKAVSTALRTIEQERSLRALFRSEAEAARLLCRLFGIWGSTLLSLGNCFPSDHSGIGRVVIDEAGQCHPAHALSALMRADAALVIGDVHQLSPVIELGADDDARLLRSRRLRTPAHRLAPYRVNRDAATSSQSLADRAVSTRGRLTDHFRCQSEIIAVSDALCGYGLTVHTPRADRSQHAPFLKRPLSMVDLRGEQAPLAGSWCNELELHEALTLVESLLRGGVQLAEIAVITPYRGQLERLRHGLAQRRIPIENSGELAETGGSGPESHGVALGTVHRFQGGERSIVLFSSVVTHVASLAFLNTRPNLLNVALSRAQHHFVCLGHAALLSKGPLSRRLVEGAVALLPTAYGGGHAPGAPLEPLGRGSFSRPRETAEGARARLR
jgi:hypothetical protein